MCESKNALNIKQFVEEVLETFNCNKVGNIFVTDNAGNVVNACKGYIHVSCAGHNINLVLKHSLKDSKLKLIPNLVKNVKEIITQLKRSCKMRELSKLGLSVPQEVETRFNSKYRMLHQFMLKFENIRSYAFDNNNSNLGSLILGINMKIIKPLVEILKNFNTATELLSYNEKPTLNLVLPLKQKLLTICEVNENDIMEIKHFKSVLKSNIEKYYKISDIHKVATFLDPNKKKLKFLDDCEKENVYKSLDSYLDESEVQELSDSPKKKKLKIQENSFLEDLNDSEEECEQQNESLRDEINDYLCAKTFNAEDILYFWKNNTNKYCKLAKIAKIVLSVPATQFESERNFSISGRTLEDRRSCLSPENVDKLLFIKSQLKDK
jgi:hypothetical protein